MNEHSQQPAPPCSVAMIVAMGRNRVIGLDNAMPWHLPRDLQYFKACTLGKPVVMGRKTFLSIGRALPGRPNIVLTRDRGFNAEGVEVVHSVEQALVSARRAAQALAADEIMVIGGAQIYQLMLSQAQRLYITEVEAEPPGDACFPVLDSQQWCLTHDEAHPADQANGYGLHFRVYQRVQG